ncbi:hypothetical protein KEM52_006542 [Ascosphaera acerosa]|nr:hypothetical protein KEM52_006542 [Ascosphaera acerosa]
MSLRDGLAPTAPAYNALLCADVHLHGHPGASNAGPAAADARQAVPTALDIYSDMLRRNVAPDADTFAILVPLLASRALACLDQLALLDQQRRRFACADDSGSHAADSVSPSPSLLRSSDAERALLAEDHSLATALRLFATAKARHPSIKFAADVYYALIHACARSDNVAQMIEIMADMEAAGAAPHASLFPLMIDAFARARDLKSAVECYNEYKSLAVADDAGVFGIVGRADAQVYASVVRAYLACGKREGALRFVDKIASSFGDAGSDAASGSQLAAIRAVIYREGFIAHAITSESFEEALSLAQEHIPRASLADTAAKICIAAADAGDAAVATQAYALLGTAAASPTPATPSTADAQSQLQSQSRSHQHSHSHSHSQPQSQSLSRPSPLPLDPAVSMLALHVRRNDLAAAAAFWHVLTCGAALTPAMVHPTAMYATALLRTGKPAEAFAEARAMFARIRSSPAYTTAAPGAQLQVREEIDEAIDLLGGVAVPLVASASSAPAVPLPPAAAMDLLWAMVENGGLVSPITEHVVAGLDAKSITLLGRTDLALLLQAQAGMLADPEAMATAAAGAAVAAQPLRFAHMLDVAMARGVPAPTLREPAVEAAVARLFDSGTRSDVVARWQWYVSPRVPAQAPMPMELQPVQMQMPMQMPMPVQAPALASVPPSIPLPMQTPGTPALTFGSQSGGLASPAQTMPPASPSPHGGPPQYALPEDKFDPYARTTDFRGSAQIAEILEATHGRPHQHLTTALAKFRDMRRVGRHPRYITYAKLITAAARFNRTSLVHEILAMARHDIPLLPGYQLVAHGWASILDAMVAACLTCGERASAEMYHQELRSIGAAPSANTFGLYITTMKEGTKTFDEATEAVKIFQRALAEGVEPTSFLYNALIGKLGKARRIDDCLLYFAEMRRQGIRPTSVTYGTVVNALCRVSDEHFAEEMFDEMESMPNYKPRPAPYNSMMQYFLTTKRDRAKVLMYYERMRARGIQPTMHTYKLLIDAYASLEPVRMDLAEQTLREIRAHGRTPEAMHYAALVHARGCVLHDVEGAQRTFAEVLAATDVKPQACLFQAMFEALVAQHRVVETRPLLAQMAARGVEMTPYIANTLIHGWAAQGDIASARQVYDDLGLERREPSTYEAMVRAYLAVGKEADAAARASMGDVVAEMVSRGYPSAVTGKVLELIAGGTAAAAAAAVQPVPPHSH